jgi:hypothetical protein
LSRGELDDFILLLGAPLDYFDFVTLMADARIEVGRNNIEHETSSQ